MAFRVFLDDIRYIDGFVSQSGQLYWHTDQLAGLKGVKNLNWYAGGIEHYRLKRVSGRIYGVRPEFLNTRLTPHEKARKEVRELDTLCHERMELLVAGNLTEFCSVYRVSWDEGPSFHDWLEEMRRKVRNSLWYCFERP